MTTTVKEEEAVAVDNNYSDAVAGGHYDLYEGGLYGKHDNVRTYWEDQIRCMRLKPHLQSLVRRKRRAGEKVRVADLGAGSGEGLRLLTSMNEDDMDLHLNQKKVLPMEMIEEYLGADLCGAMVEQGNRNFDEFEQVSFVQGDFSQGFPMRDSEPFDLYFCTYGSYSHIDDEAMEQLLSEIFEHAGKRALIVGDWLGRYSVEWPCYWGIEGPEMLDYSMSYLPGSNSETAECFPMRYWTGDELQALIGRVANRTGVRVKTLEQYDTSVFTGRHVDTQEYNDWMAPLRSVVNCLHEENVRTDLELLKAHLCPVEGHEKIYGHLASMSFAWNNLVGYCISRLEKRISPFHVHNWRQLPPPVQMGMMTLDRTIDAAHWLQMGDPRANIIEPQLGYSLRAIEMEMQNGTGCGHSLVGVLEIRK